MAKRGKEDSAGTIRLFIYSGRPDPEWKLEATDLKGLQELLREVAGGESTHPPPPGGLGYRGFLVRGVSTADEGSSDFEVFRSVVTERRGTRVKHWRDTHGLERWLLDQARQQGHGKVLDDEGLSSEAE